MTMNNNLILLVEDDRRLADLVKDFLESNDFAVVVEAHGNRVIRQCQNVNPALIILDIMLPGKDGLTLCQELRPEYKGPILMLTARNEDVDQVLGLNTAQMITSSNRLNPGYCLPAFAPCYAVTIKPTCVNRKCWCLTD